MVNFNLFYCEFLLKFLVGVGVVFYVMLVLCGKMWDENLFIGIEFNLVELFDLVVLGMVVDVVLFDYNNCILVY